MRKVKNVIKGYSRQYEITELHIIDLSENEVLFGGNIEKYLNPTSMMDDYKKEVDEKEVLNSICHNMSKIYIFV